MSTSQTRDRPPSLLACSACRKKHLRCDAKMPVCTRCERRGMDCVFIESKRGLKGSKEKPRLSKETRVALRDDVLQHGDDYRSSTSNQEIVATFDHESSSDYSGSTQSFSRGPGLIALTGAHATIREDDYLLETFYKYFFPAHPFVLPRRYRPPAMLPEHLKRVMRFVASNYLPAVSQENLRHAADMVFTDNIAEDEFKVQSLLLLAMSSYARFEQARGAETLDLAIDIALRIGMNWGNSSAQVTNDPILQESWRRTWWDLYIVDGLVSALEGSTYVSRLRSTACDVQLPGTCEDYVEYRSQTSLRSLQDMQDRAFADDGYEWSSFAYKIEAMRILGTVLQLGPDTFATNEAEVEAIDASISSFMLSMPSNKRELVAHNGTVDEVLFGAHMIIHWAAINLHRPRSSLTFIRNHYPTACTREEAVGMPALAYASHNSKALHAANAISTLTAIQSPMTTHTPCYCCATALAATVQLPSYIIAESSTDRTRLKERLRLSVTALGAIGEVWPLASVVKSQVAQFAKEVLAGPPADALGAKSGSVSSESFAQIDMGMFNEESWLDDLLQGGDVHLEPAFDLNH